ncbi:hypothetical protein BH11ACT8_BH11ACT8_16830 [soil metagenome]
MSSRRPPARILAGLPVLVSAAVLLAGCQHSDSELGPAGDPIAASDAAQVASVQDFCGAYGLTKGLAADEDDADLALELRDNAAKLADVGTPRDIPRAARAGYVVYVAATSVVTTDEARAMVGAHAGDVVTALDVAAADAPAVTAFQEYVAGTCFTTRR